MNVWTWLIPVLVALAGTGSTLFFVWRAEKRRREADAQRTRADRAEERLAVEKASYDDQVARLEASLRVLRQLFDANRKQLHAILEANPHMAGDFLRSVLREAAEPSATSPEGAAPGDHPAGGLGWSGGGG